MGITRELAKFCAKLTFNDLPAEVVESTKYLAFDFFGVAARGSVPESSQVMFKFIKELCCPGGGIVIASNYTTLVQYAALANGTFAHSLELDDVCNEASLHPGVAIFPATLAACEVENGSGKDFITAAAAGYEVMCRLGKALNPAKHYGRGFHPTGTCGVFGAAVAAGKLFKLDEKQMTDALGIAGSQAAASMEFLTEGTWTKRMHPGWAAHSGLIAALLAREGYKAPSTIIEGKYGFLNAYSYNTNAEEVLENLGKEYYVTKTSIKPHSCCRYKQAPIDGILQIVKENHLHPEDVSEVIIGMLEVGYPIVVEPFDLKYNPQSIVDAQFSMPFGAAVTILYGKASLDEYTEKVVKSEKVKTMMKKIKFIKDPKLDRLFPKQWPASVFIKTNDGKEYETFIEYPKGDPENPLTWDELVGKFNDITKVVFNSERQDKILNKVKNMDRAEELTNLYELLNGKDY